MSKVEYDSVFGTAQLMQCRLSGFTFHRQESEECEGGEVGKPDIDSAATTAEHSRSFSVTYNCDAFAVVPTSAIQCVGLDVCFVCLVR